MQGSKVNGTAGRHRVHVISRRVVRPDPHPTPSSSAPETIHLTPWDLRMLSLDYIHKGVLLPKPNANHQPAVCRRTPRVGVGPRPRPLPPVRRPPCRR
ncbi:unnamed protein product [Urochloa humidicola]